MLDSSTELSSNTAPHDLRPVPEGMGLFFCAVTLRGRLRDRDRTGAMRPARSTCMFATCDSRKRFAPASGLRSRTEGTSICNPT